MGGRTLLFAIRKTASQTGQRNRHRVQAPALRAVPETRSITALAERAPVTHSTRRAHLAVVRGQGPRPAISHRRSAHGLQLYHLVRTRIARGVRAVAARRTPRRFHTLRPRRRGSAVLEDCRFAHSRLDGCWHETASLQRG